MRNKKLSKVERQIIEDTKGMTETQIREYAFRFVGYFVEMLKDIQLEKKYKEKYEKK